jgi:hypothetical protein
VVCKINTALRINTNCEIIMCSQKSPLSYFSNPNNNFGSIISEFYNDQKLMNKCDINCHENINAVFDN